MATVRLRGFWCRGSWRGSPGRELILTASVDVRKSLKRSRTQHRYIPYVYTRRCMARSTIFKTNRSQAVRLPKALAFPDDVRQVEIIKLGQSRLITPAGRRWDEFFLNGAAVSDDFMTKREQPVVQDREQL